MEENFRSHSPFRAATELLSALPLAAQTESSTWRWDFTCEVQLGLRSANGAGTRLLPEVCNLVL